MKVGDLVLWKANGSFMTIIETFNNDWVAVLRDGTLIPFPVRFLEVFSDDR